MFQIICLTLSLPSKLSSGDTGGLIEEGWVTPIVPKLELLARVQPLYLLTPPSLPSSLPPSSGDTGGLVEEDWVTPIVPKLELLARVQPDPTQVMVDKAGKVTMS